MKINVHLTFRGECEAAFRFYERCLGGTIVTMLTYGASPAAGQTPEAQRDKIIHATLAIGEQTLAGADVFGDDYRPAQGFYVLLELEDPLQAERVFTELSQNGEVRMPLQETFWARRFGVLLDQFGTPWEINCGNMA